MWEFALGCALGCLTGFVIGVIVAVAIWGSKEPLPWDV